MTQLRYANNSNYKNDTMIRKEVYVSKTVVNELKRILEDSEVSCWQLAIITLTPSSWKLPFLPSDHQRR